MVALIGLVLSIVISLCWYLPVVKAQGDNSLLRGKDYTRIALQYGFFISCILIITTEIIWDRLVGRTSLTGLTKSLLSSITRAAFLEELFKFLGFSMARRKLQLRRKIDFVLTAGMIGVVYSIVEKAATLNIGNIIIGLIIPMHIMWQFNQGGHYYEYEQAKATGNIELARKELLMALLVPFVFHAIWDSGLDIIAYFIEAEAIALEILGMALGVAIVIFGILYCVKTVKKMRQLAKEAPAIVEKRRMHSAKIKRKKLGLNEALLYDSVRELEITSFIVSKKVLFQLISCQFTPIRTCFAAVLARQPALRYNGKTSLLKEGERNHETKCEKPVQRYSC